jgi:hypothetical protein
MWHIWGRTEMHSRFSWRNLNEKGHLEHMGLDGRIILKWTLKKYDWWAWTRFGWLTTGTSGTHL